MLKTHDVGSIESAYDMPLMNATKVLAALKGPRFWTLFSTLCTRGVGFVTSFALARLAGPQWLGAYTAVLNTASAVTSPIAQVLSNNATLVAADAHRNGKKSFRAHARGHLLLGIGLSLPACLLLAWLLRSTKGEASGGVWEMMLLAGICVAIGQVLTGIILGFYQGAGHVLAAARVTAIVAAAMGTLAIPMVWFSGVGGALAIASAVAILPTLILGFSLFRMQDWQVDKCTTGTTTIGGKPMREALWRLWRALPSVGAMAINAAVNWACTIYLVRGEYGLAGVGLVAIAIQWSTLVLMPATSWGGLTLKALTDSVATRRRAQVREAVRRQILRNVKTTAMTALVVGLGSGLIARAYSLSETDLWMLLCVNAMAATVASINNVFERLLLCLDAQPRWFAQSVVAFGVQVTFTATLIHLGLVVVALGVLLAGITQLGLSICSMKSLLNRLKTR